VRAVVRNAVHSAQHPLACTRMPRVVCGGVHLVSCGVDGTVTTRPDRPAETPLRASQIFAAQTASRQTRGKRVRGIGNHADKTRIVMHNRVVHVRSHGGGRLGETASLSQNVSDINAKTPGINTMRNRTHPHDVPPRAKPFDVTGVVLMFWSVARARVASSSSRRRVIPIARSRRQACARTH
jgi:hypothetical protein